MPQAKFRGKFIHELLEIPFFQYVVYDQGRDRGTRLVSGGDIQQKRKVKTFGLAGRPSVTQFPLLVGHLDLPP